MTHALKKIAEPICRLVHFLARSISSLLMHLVTAAMQLCLFVFMFLVWERVEREEARRRAKICDDPADKN